MKIKLLLFLVIFSVFNIHAQSNKELADKYLSKRGELAFTFTANNLDEINQLSRIISFDHGNDRNNPLTIKAIANNKNFKQFLAFNLPFEVNIEANEPKNVVMFDPEIHKKGVSGKNAAYPLTFPLSTYPTYQQYADQMAAFAADHPAIAELVDIGGTVQGDKRLLFIKLSDNVLTREAEPRVMYTSSMHGDEIAGFPGMLNLIDYFIRAYKNIDENGDPLAVDHPDHVRIANLLDNSEVWINPLANPDATYWLSSTNTSVANSRRENANNVDLNRNYPDNVAGAHDDGEVYQTETLAFMQFAADYHFVLSANLHGGIELVNYPFDNAFASTTVYHSEDPSGLGPYYTHPDTNWFEYVSVEYASQAQNDSPSGYMTTDEDSYIYPSTGVTHGAEWYRVYGGRQDYMNFYHQCREITVEISDVKTPPSTNTSSNDEVIDIWNYNKEAYIKFLIQGTYGFRGVVKDASTGDPIDAKITIIGRDDQATPVTNSWVETELFPGTELGDFYRPIEAGTYDILIESAANCYISQTFSRTISNNETINLGDILLQKVTNTAPSTSSTTAITTTTATLNWDNVVGASNYDIEYREQGDTNWTPVTSSVNSYNLTGLTLNTTYEFQVRVTCDSNTSAYSSIANFTTPAVNPCTGTVFSDFATGYSESFESGFGDWSQGANGVDDDIEWTRDSNGTPTINTGPSSASNGSFYLYTEGNDGNYNSAMLISPCFDLTGYKNASFTFDFHWYGRNLDNNQASLTLEVSIDNGLSYNPLFSHMADDANNWITNQVIDLSGYDGQTLKLRFTGITGDGTRSDMAIDNIYLTAEVDTSLGIQDELLSEFVLYPNPVKDGEIKLRMPKEITDFNVTISNVLGQKVYQKEVISNYNNLHKVNTSNFKQGIYFVTVSTNLGMATKKMIIQ